MLKWNFVIQIFLKYEEWYCSRNTKTTGCTEGLCKLLSVVLPISCKGRFLSFFPYFGHLGINKIGTFASTSPSSTSILWLLTLSWSRQWWSSERYKTSKSNPVGRTSTSSSVSGSLISKSDIIFQWDSCQDIINVLKISLVDLVKDTESVKIGYS